MRKHTKKRFIKKTQNVKASLPIVKAQNKNVFLLYLIIGMLVLFYLQTFYNFAQEYAQKIATLENDLSTKNQQRKILTELTKYIVGLVAAAVLDYLFGRRRK
jgi:hypothetical protein